MLEILHILKLSIALRWNVVLSNN